MNKPHVPEPLLQRFALGDLDEAAAVEVALHLDSCASCSTRAAALEPLALVFACSDDPPIPDGIAAEVLAAAARPSANTASARPGPEPVLAGVLLTGAALALLATGSPASLLVRIATGARALLTAASALLAHSPSPGPTATLAAAVALAAATLLARSLDLNRRRA